MRVIAPKIKIPRRGLGHLMEDKSLRRGLGLMKATAQALHIHHLAYGIPSDETLVKTSLSRRSVKTRGTVLPMVETACLVIGSSTLAMIMCTGLPLQLRLSMPEELSSHLLQLIVRQDLLRKCHRRRQRLQLLTFATCRGSILPQGYRKDYHCHRRHQLLNQLLDLTA